jgi:hypothetical protein
MVTDLPEGKENKLRSRNFETLISGLSMSYDDVIVRLIITADNSQNLNTQITIEEGKAIPVTDHRGSHVFQIIGSQMAMTSSSLRPGRPAGRPSFTPRKIPGTRFC